MSGAGLTLVDVLAIAINLARQQGSQRLADAPQPVGDGRDLTVAIPFVRARHQLDVFGALGRVRRQTGLKLTCCFGRAAPLASGVWATTFGVPKPPR